MSNFNFLTQDQVIELMGQVNARLQQLDERIIHYFEVKANNKEWLTAKEAQEILKISGTTLHDWSNKGILKKHKIGDRIRFRYDELIEAMTRMESKSKRV